MMEEVHQDMYREAEQRCLMCKVAEEWPTAMQFVRSCRADRCALYDVTVPSVEVFFVWTSYSMGTRHASVFHFDLLQQTANNWRHRCDVTTSLYMLQAFFEALTQSGSVSIPCDMKDSTTQAILSMLSHAHPRAQGLTKLAFNQKLDHSRASDPEPRGFDCRGVHDLVPGVINRNSTSLSELSLHSFPPAAIMKAVPAIVQLRQLTKLDLGVRLPAHSPADSSPPQQLLDAIETAITHLPSIRALTLDAAVSKEPKPASEPPQKRPRLSSQAARDNSSSKLSTASFTRTLSKATSLTSLILLNMFAIAARTAILCSNSSSRFPSLQHLILYADVPDDCKAPATQSITLNPPHAPATRDSAAERTGESQVLQPGRLPSLSHLAYHGPAREQVPDSAASEATPPSPESACLRAFCYQTCLKSLDLKFHTLDVDAAFTLYRNAFRLKHLETLNLKFMKCMRAMPRAMHYMIRAAARLPALKKLDLTLPEVQEGSGWSSADVRTKLLAPIGRLTELRDFRCRLTDWWEEEDDSAGEGGGEEGPRPVDASPLATLYEIPAAMHLTRLHLDWRAEAAHEVALRRLQLSPELKHLELATVDGSEKQVC